MEMVLLTDATGAWTPNLMKVAGTVSSLSSQSSKKYAGALPIHLLYPYPSVQARVNGE